MWGSYRGRALYIAPVSGFPFDAVLFDLDGTLVATDSFWPDVARVATLRVFQERGISPPVPGAAEWMAMVGLPLEQAFEVAFGDLDGASRSALLTACGAGHAQLDRHGATLLAGVEETLTELAARGVRLGIASNCAPEYLGLMLTAPGWSGGSRRACLASPGVRDKADMVEDLLHTFGTRSAVMVGDRAGDRDAAWANGLPHVHIPRGYCGGGDDGVEAEAVLAGMEELVPACMARAQTLRELGECLDGARRVVVTGLPFAGRSGLGGAGCGPPEAGSSPAEVQTVEPGAAGAAPLGPTRWSRLGPDRGARAPGPRACGARAGGTTGRGASRGAALARPASGRGASRILHVDSNALAPRLR